MLMCFVVLVCSSFWYNRLYCCCNVYSNWKCDLFLFYRICLWAQRSIAHDFQQIFPPFQPICFVLIFNKENHKHDAKYSTIARVCRISTIIQRRFWRNSCVFWCNVVIIVNNSNDKRFKKINTLWTKSSLVKLGLMLNDWIEKYGHFSIELMDEELFFNKLTSYLLTTVKELSMVENCRYEVVNGKLTIVHKKIMK